MSEGAELRRRIKEVMVDELMLDYGPDEIEDATPLFGTGLGLDSVDALQLVIAIEKNFGFKISDSKEAKSILATVESIANAIEKRAVEDA
jgi:acyl carrier protein